MRQLLYGVLVLYTSLSRAADICNDLAKLSCGPGEFNDGTGLVKSEEQIQSELAQFSERAKLKMQSKFGSLIHDADNPYFRDLAMSALGLSGNPICQSTDIKMIQQCDKNLSDGLTTWGQRLALGELHPRPSLLRGGNFRDMNSLVLNAKFLSVVHEVKADARKALVDPNEIERIKNKVFPQVKTAIVARIQELNIADDKKKFMISKIKSIEFAGTHCEDPGAEKRNLGAGDSVSEMLIPNAFYKADANTFTYCEGLILQSNSDFQIAATIAHELSHSIDPCLIDDGPADFGFKYVSTDIVKMEKEHPLSNILECLRSKNSIEAHNFHFEQLHNPSVSSTHVVSTSGEGQEEKPPNFCEKDQITESFCDWLSAETVPRYIEKNYKLSTEQYKLGYMNAWRPFCQIKTAEDRLATQKKENWDEHPLNEERINKIILANNKIRTQMKCSPEPNNSIYCDPNKQYVSPYEAMEASGTTTAVPQTTIIKEGIDLRPPGVSK